MCIRDRVAASLRMSRFYCFHLASSSGFARRCFPSLASCSTLLDVAHCSLLHQLLCFALIVKYEFHPPSCVLSLLRRCLCCRARRYSCCATLIMIWYGNHNYIYIYNIYINIYIYILYAVVVLLVLVVRHTHDLHKCYLRGHFRCFFSRYPSVALASNNVLRVLEPQPVSRSNSKGRGP